MACPAPAEPARGRKRRRKAARRGQAGSVLLLAALALIFGYAFYAQGLPGTQGAAGEANPVPQLTDQLRAALPPNAVVLRALPMANGEMALAWRDGDAARTGIAYPEPGGYRLWVAQTPQASDVAADAEVALMELPGLSNPVLVSTYRTDGCCAWVHLFEAGPQPRVLFASPTHSARLLPSGIVVREQLPGEYPDGPAAHVHTYTWDGARFHRTGLALAPQYYFPLVPGMKWTYRRGEALVDRWVQEGRTEGHETVYLVRSVARRGTAISEEPDATYSYTLDGQVRQVTPAPRTVLGPSPGLGSAWEGAAVEAVLDTLRTPAGEFRQVLVVASGSVKRYYAPDVGLVREEIGGKVSLDLVTYSIP